MAVAPRVSLVTLGVRDVALSEAFYRALGWEVVVAADDGFRMFRTFGAWLTLWPAESLWADAGIPPPAEPRFGGVVLAMNLDSPADVDGTLATGPPVVHTHVPAACTRLPSSATKSASKDPDCRFTPTVMRPDPPDAPATQGPARRLLSLMPASSDGVGGRSMVWPPGKLANGAKTVRPNFSPPMVP